MTDTPVFLVAGASSGMGRKAALKLGEGEGHVVLAARREEACEEAAAQIRAGGGSAEALQFDGTDAESCHALIAAIEDKHGRLDGAFNNLGDTLGDSPLHETPPERWDATIAVNLSSVFHLMQAQVPLMLKNGGGRIVNNSSTGGLRGTKAMSDYSAAKWGVIGLTKSAALDYASQGLVINAIAPGIIATEKFREFEKRVPEIFEKIRVETPIERFGDMGEIADVVDWLLRSAPGYLNGAVLPIDGARTA
ncbi:SDR family NAD(P)-dependent oxidoreductase [Altererythrobacter lutimaris]|uniref:SDR family oxidoreductase n=1 Tax=Altererythrobacter lutimaris TaxID=2743979 RepID=A0A850H8F1_9SPHN|nr:SDR family NAD(P)-dependent oxidoreductase [Altererythrobacter lutimaris]NVE93505.1 SDR family oxidoreductase [Altererythrobacter lutimaris]